MDQNSKIYVGGLAYSTTEAELEEYFAQYGTVKSASIIMDRETNRSKGFGFVEMSTPEEADAAIDALNNQEFAGRRLTVNKARPQTDRRSGGGGGGGNGGGGGSFRRSSY